ncbi:nucleotide-binding alpha-beta plait domain-containing protein [Tanacetum coccineum]|uniref:Nucleotide-binding alpha-beta plait domain-containing protein n=1 Tax=Tanacetum coccineum TaxID=301880 RepID=A0ABQ5HL78_9ASTR
MAHRRSFEEDVNSISTSIFVTNFPDQFYAKDLWKVCNQYVSVVDAFIPHRSSKSGKRFDFVRFIGVFDVDRLVNNLCTIWVDRFKLHANKARFHKTPLNRSNVHDKGVIDSVPQVVNKRANSSLTNLKVALDNEGFNNITLKYMGGYWVMIDFQTVDSKDKFKVTMGTCSWFSELQQASSEFHINERVTWVDIKGMPLKDATCYHSKRICIKTKIVENIFESFKIIIKGKIFWVRAKEVSGWILDFNEEEEEETDSDGDVKEDELDVENNERKEQIVVKDESEVEEVSETIFEKSSSIGFTPRGTDEFQSEVEKEGDGRSQNVQDDAMLSGVKKTGHSSNSKYDHEDKCKSICSGHFKKIEVPRAGGSMIQLMEDLVKVGQTMGYNMEGCSKNMEEIIGSIGAYENPK